MSAIPATLVTTYLHMIDRAMFRPAYSDSADVTISHMAHPDPEYYRFLYRSVGEIWRWRDRLHLSDQALAMLLEDANTVVYVLYVDGVPGGYIELNQQSDDVEVAYFGLRLLFIGRGLGKHLLSYGVARAWEMGAARVWLHTCNLDGPHALANYRARGFVVYRVNEEPMPQKYF